MSCSWNSNRIIIGLLLLTLLWLGAWTSLDRSSSLLFIAWLVAGAFAFKRGESEQGALGKAQRTDRRLAQQAGQRSHDVVWR